MYLTKAHKKAFEQGIERGGILRITQILNCNRGDFSSKLTGKKNVTPDFVEQMMNAKKQYLAEVEAKRLEEEAKVNKIINA